MEDKNKRINELTILANDLAEASQSLAQENDKLRKGLITITNMVDNQNPTHEEIWRIARFTLEELTKTED